MINWKYVAPRLILAAAAVLAVWLGLDPLLRYTLCAVGSRLLGAKVEIGGSHTSLAGASLRLDRVQVANPNSPLKNLVEAREASLELETPSLLKRKFVVREGRLSGLTFGSDRQTSGALQEIDLPHVTVDIDEQRLAEEALAWLNLSADALRTDLEQELESVRLAKELMQRWPAEYEQLVARADDLQRRIKALKQLLDRPDASARSFEEFRRSAAEADAVRDEIAALRERLKALPREAQRDKAALVAAQQRDVEHLRQKFWLKNLDAQTLSQYLLGPERGKQVDELLAWVRWSRQFLPDQVDSADPARGRGVTVQFPGAQRTPDFLVRSLRIDGETQLGNQRVRFAGEAAGLTTEPKVYGRPATIVLRTEGPAPLSIAATLDRSGVVPHDSLRIVCPKIQQPRRVLGRADQLALAVSPGTVELDVLLDLTGDELSGHLTLVQEPIELTPTLAAKFGGERLARGMTAALADVHRLDVIVELSGSLAQPRWKLSSNLGPELAASIQGVFQRELDAGREELAKQVETHTNEQQARLDRLLAAKEQEIAAKLNLGDQDLAQLTRQFASRLGLPNNVLPGNLKAPKLPKVDLFKR